MSMKERGQYITLLCLQCERGHMTEQEMKKAIGGKLSDELKRKFSLDNEGKFYNERMDEEIKKRDAHSKKQRDKINKRWEKNREKNTGSGTPSGNTAVNTVVLPLGNGNGNTSTSYSLEPAREEEERRESKQGDRGYGGKGDSACDPEYGRVIAFYQDRINPTCGRISAEGLRDFTEQLGADVVIHALEVALDERKYSWSYIQAILTKYASDGLNSLDAVLRSEQEFYARKQERKTSAGFSEESWNPFLEIAREEDAKREQGRNSESS